MVEILRTNDIVLLSLVETLLAEADIATFVADRHMSAVEGSLGFLPRRVLVDSEEAVRACRLLSDAGLGRELRRE